METVEQLTDEQARRIGRATYYATMDCSDGQGSVIPWESLSAARQEYYVGIASVVLTEDAAIRGLEIVPRRAES